SLLPWRLLTILGSATPTTVWSRAKRNIASRIAPRISSFSLGDRLRAASADEAEWVMGVLHGDWARSSWGKDRTTAVRFVDGVRARNSSAAWDSFARPISPPGTVRRPP